MTLIQDLPVPVIAMVNNFISKAAGCQLVASCDIAVATDKSSFATPGVNVGMLCATPGVAIGRAVPRESVRWCMRNIWMEETLAIAHIICKSSRPESALGKTAFQRQMAQTVMVDNLVLHDGQEGIRPFVEKC
ncbi:hypothetical protein Q7C36_015332 [Tachysurus vachellii]|uniref:Enoyl-CoA hydratase domain-containing protein 3, mitochondrial n=1 Tax=Tachysurus vachellii TaxID=175792 RepID=A0AA88SK86_TACVA|nr:hypothetical protein Q7C36_015332 [Tachysurus vachellii]